MVLVSFIVRLFLKVIVILNGSGFMNKEFGGEGRIVRNSEKYGM